MYQSIANEVETLDVTATYTLNNEKNGVEIRFNGKPSEEIRNEMKLNKFRYSPRYKVWYAKQNTNTIALAERLSNGSKNEYNSDNPQTLDNFKELYEAINIDDLDNYIISESLSRGENDANWIFRTKEVDHSKVVNDLFVELNNEAKNVISTLNNDYYIYKVKTLLQSTKKKYYNAYTSWLNAKISCPSWVVTGRDGRSASRYEKGMSRIEKWEREKWTIIDNFNKKLEYYQYKEIKEKENKTRQEIEKAMETIDINDIKFTTKRMNMEGTSCSVYGQLQCYIADNYFICKAFGKFRIFNLATKEELHAMKSKDKLTDAKKYVAYLISKNN